MWALPLPRRLRSAGVAGETDRAADGAWFAGFFTARRRARAALSRFFGSLVAFLFIAISGRLLLIQALEWRTASRWGEAAFLRAASLPQT